MLACRVAYWLFKCLRGLAPDYLAKKPKTRSEIHNRDTRNTNKIDIPGYRTALGQRTLDYRAVSLWNALPERGIQEGTYALFRIVLVRSLFLRQGYLLFLSS